MAPEDEDKELRQVALQHVQVVLQARQRAEHELLRTKEALEEETRVLELLNRTGTLLASKLELQDLVQSVTDAATELSGGQFGAFFYAGDDGDSFGLFALSGAPRAAFEHFGHPRATPIFGPTFRAEGVVRIADVLEDARYGQWAPHFGMPPGHLPVRSYLAVPVVARSGAVLGALLFGHRDPGVFSERSERLVVGVAAQAAVAIDNARMYAQATRAAEQRASLLEQERLARVEVERVSLMKDEFLATLSHELRTPMNAILGWSQLLHARSTPGSDDHRGLETILRNARAQAQLIEDLIDMNRIVSGMLRLEPQRVELSAVAGAVLESLRPSAEARNIQLRKIVETTSAPFFADPQRLQQIVWNLLSNAIKFTPPAGSVELHVRHSGGQAEIVVRDSGAGIAPEFLPHVFERFRQADSSTTRRHGGLGLGLSIVKQLVELHGGTVHAESAGAGLGSTFVVQLPLGALRDSAAKRASARLRESAGETLSLQGVVVLVVDDDSDALGVAQAVLASAGAEVLPAGSAAEALTRLRRDLPHVIVSDIGMPERDGYQFMGDVRALSPAEGGKTPALALTAFARAEDRTRALIAGFQAHLAKPIEPPALIRAVASLVAHRT